MRKPIVWLFVLVALACMSWAAWNGVRRAERSRAEVSIQRMLDAALGPGVAIEDCRVETGTDVGIDCRVRLPAPRSPNAPPVGFALADEADHRYYRSLVETEGLTMGSPQGFAVYRGDQHHADGTMCAAAPCGAYLLLKPGDRVAFAGLWKL